jgi:hypothetical protein
LFNNQWVIDNIKQITTTFLEVSENENTNYRNLCDTAKVVLRGKFIAISAYLKKQKNLKSVT